MPIRQASPSDIFLNLNPAVVNAQEKAVESHLKSAFEHIQAALQLLSQRKKKITGFSGQQFLFDALSIVGSVRKFLPSFISSQPDLMLYTEGDLSFEIGTKFKEVEESLTFVSTLADSGGVNTSSFDQEVQALGSRLLETVSSFVGQLSQLSEETQNNLGRLERALSEIASLTSESRLLENLRRPGIRSEIERVHDCLSSFMRSYLQEKGSELESVDRVDRVRRKREKRVTGLRLPGKRFFG